MLSQLNYINLDKRSDRNEAFILEMSNFKDCFKNIVRFPAIEKKRGALGCAQSHIIILENHLKGNFKDEICLIFEDDFVWKVSEEYFSQTMKCFLESQVKWDAVTFSACIWGLETGPCDNDILRDKFERVYSSQTTTGYMVHPTYIPTLLKTFKHSAKMLESTEIDNYAIDQEWKKIQKRDTWYISSPTFGKQADGYSDIECQNVNYHFI